MDQDNVGVVRGMYEAFARGDLPAVLAGLDPEVRWIEAAGFPGIGGVHIGPAAVAQVLTVLAAEWDGFKIVPQEYLGNGDRVVVLGESSGRHKSTGKEFRSPFAHALVVRDGRIAEWQAFIDTALARDAAK